MELPLLPLLLLSLPFLLLVITTTKYKKPNSDLPPSPPTLPLIGNLHQLGPLAHRSLHALALTYGPLLSLRLGQVPTIVVSSAAAACEVTTTQDAAFASRPLLKVSRKLLYGSKSISFSPYGDYWRQARKVAVLHLLSARRVQSYRPVREEEVALLVARIADRSAAASQGAVNLTQLLNGFANDVICRVALGKQAAKEGDQYGTGVVYEYLEEASALAGGFHAEDFFPSFGWLVSWFSGLDAKLERTFRKMDGYIDEVIDSHMAAGRKGGESGDDLVHVLLSFQEDHSLPRDDLKALIVDMFIAGTETTSIFLQWAMSELIRHPAIMKNLQEEVRRIAGTKALVSEDDLSEMHYMKAVVKEVLRLHPPVPLLLPRESISDAQLQGYKVPIGTRIIINYWAIGRDPASWEAPEEFLPERFIGSPLDFKGHDFQLIPFGAGRRICPGMQFAVVDMELALANLVHCFNWKMADGKRGKQLDMEEAPGLTIHRKSDLVLVAERRLL